METIPYTNVIFYEQKRTFYKYLIFAGAKIRFQTLTCKHNFLTSDDLWKL
jgi:hypothetical protein